VALEEISEAVGRGAALAATVPHFPEGERRVLRVRVELGRRDELLLGAREIARVREDNAEIVARLPELWIDRDRRVEQLDRLVPSIRVLGELDSLDHPRHGLRVGGREGRARRDGRRRRVPAAGSE